MFTDRKFDAYQEFYLGCKIYWSTELYPKLQEEYDARVAQSADGTPRPQSAEDAAGIMQESTLYKFYGFLERHLQRFKYSGRLGLVPAHEVHRKRLLEELDSTDAWDGLLELKPEFQIPDYFSSVDIHQHPGGVWSDELAGYVYERGARSTTPLTTRHKDLHDRFTGQAVQDIEPKRVIDMGCGFGKSTWPFIQNSENMEIVGIDLAAPCLRFAARDAVNRQAKHVRFVQADASDTDFDDESFDLVTSTMMLHEMPPKVVKGVIKESYRLLEPGGKVVHLDFLVPDGNPFGQFIHYGHSRRNNEPYMPPLNRMDLIAEHEAVGFKNVRIAPFEEAPGALNADNNKWRFPWTTIIAEK